MILEYAIGGWYDVYKVVFEDDDKRFTVQWVGEMHPLYSRLRSNAAIVVLDTSSNYHPYTLEQFYNDIEEKGGE